MSFDMRYPNRKDWREPYRGAKAVDAACRNHGGCPYCEEGRAFAALRRTPADADSQVMAAFTGRCFNEEFEDGVQESLYKLDYGYVYGDTFDVWSEPWDDDAEDVDWLDAYTAHQIDTLYEAYEWDEGLWW